MGGSALGRCFLRLKEVFYDYLDYKKLADSLTTDDKNETELKNEYTRLYNLAESNRKALVGQWNKFGLNSAKYNNVEYPLHLTDDGLYVTGNDSLLAVMDHTPVHQFNQIGLSYANGKVNVAYPENPYGVYNEGQIDTTQIEAQIAAAMKHTETYTFPKSAGGAKDLVKEQYMANVWAGMTEAQRNAAIANFGSAEAYLEAYWNQNGASANSAAMHTYRYVDATNVYNRGKDDGAEEQVAVMSQKFGSTSVWDGVATGNWDDPTSGACTWDDAATQESPVLLSKGTPGAVYHAAKEYVYGKSEIYWMSILYDPAGETRWSCIETKNFANSTAVKKKVWQGVLDDGAVRYVAKITVWRNDAPEHRMAHHTSTEYHVGECYFSIQVKPQQ